MLFLVNVNKFLKFFLISSLVCFLLGLITIFSIFIIYSKGLPSIDELKAYNPSLTSRVYSSDGILLKEYAKEDRLFVSIENVPDVIKYAFISAEDSNFYNHLGIDFFALFKAMISNLRSIKNGGNLRGASTITQQVVKNMLLTNERTLTRKIKEAILAFKITKALSKDKVLELYLNQIFLGYRSYGIVSASLNYFNKSIDDITIEDMEEAVYQYYKSMGFNFENFDEIINYDIDSQPITEDTFKTYEKMIDRLEKENFVIYK